MQQATDDTMKIIAEAIAKQVAAAEARAEKAEADRAEMKRLITLMAAIFANDDEAALPEPPEPIAEFVQPTTSKVVAQAEASRSKKSIAKSHATSPLVTAPMIAQPIVSVPARQTGKADAAILAAMANGAWMTALAIWNAIGGDNAHITRAAVYQRMPILVVRYMDVIEKHPSRNEWRLKPSGKAPRRDNDNAPVTVAPTIIAPTDIKAPLLIKDDGLAMLRKMADKSVDHFSIDLPYGMTGLECDPNIDVYAWMYEMHRVVTDRGSIVAFAAQPFTTLLINASTYFDQGRQPFFRQELIWEKQISTGANQSKGRHMKSHENILVFSRGTMVGEKRSKHQMTFNPQGATEVVKLTRSHTNNYLKNNTTGKEVGTETDCLENCPRSILYSPKDQDSLKMHPFAKPVPLLEYLIRTYTNPDALIVDPTMGSGSTCIAALNTGRRFIGAENGFDKEGLDIFEKAKTRIDAALDSKAA